MNDFTKEELRHIYDGLWMLSKLGWEKSDLTYCKKISAMIDNYCEPVCPDCGEAACFKFYKCRKNNE